MTFCTKEEENHFMINYINELISSKKINFSGSLLKIENLPGDASERKFYRIKNESNDSIILIINKEPFDKERFPYLIQQRLFRDLGIPVAEVYYADEEKGWIIIEDLGDFTLQSILKNLSYREKKEIYLKAIDILIKLHYIDEHHKKNHSLAFQLEFDTKKFFDELIFFYDNFFNKMLKLNIAKESEQKIKKNFLEIASYLSRRAKVLTHRDYHSRNIMVKNYQLFIIDFQDARMGPKTYDIISLLRDSYVEIEEGLREELLKYFLVQASMAKDEELERELIYMGLQRNIKALGTFAYQFSEKGNGHYLQYIPRTIQYIKENLLSLSELKEFREALLPYLEEFQLEDMKNLRAFNKG